jgi:predicted dehydrogenase
MANRHRIGIVGGNATRAWAHDAHVPALKKMADRFTIEAVSARTQELADEANAAFGGNRAFGDSLALVRDPDIDVVAVSVKVPEHRAVVLAALAAGKHVYCEWPLGRDLAEAEEMAAAVPKGTHVMIGTQALSAPAVLHARKLIDEGHLGELQVCRVFSPTGGWGDSAPPHYAYLQDKANGATLETIAGWAHPYHARILARPLSRSGCTQFDHAQAGADRGQRRGGRAHLRRPHARAGPP